MPFAGLFDVWGNQVIAGTEWELVRQAVELDRGVLPDFGTIPQRHWQSQVHANPFIYALLAEEAFLKGASPSPCTSFGCRW